MDVVRVGKVEDGFLELGHLVVHFVFFNVGLELGEVIDSALAVGSGDDMVRVLTNVFGDLSPGSLDGLDRVG